MFRRALNDWFAEDAIVGRLNNETRPANRALLERLLAEQRSGHPHNLRIASNADVAAGRVSVVALAEPRTVANAVTTEIRVSAENLAALRSLRRAADGTFARQGLVDSLVRGVDTKLRFYLRDTGLEPRSVYQAMAFERTARRLNLGLRGDIFTHIRAATPASWQRIYQGGLYRILQNRYTRQDTAIAFEHLGRVNNLHRRILGGRGVLVNDPWRAGQQIEVNSLNLAKTADTDRLIRRARIEALPR